MPRARATPERLSAFSDGVFAVLITVLVLELRPPELPTFEALLLLWPTWLSYAVSYLFIAIVWTNHHHLLRYATEATPACSISRICFPGRCFRSPPPDGCGQSRAAAGRLYAAVFPQANAKLFLIGVYRPRPSHGAAKGRRIMWSIDRDAVRFWAAAVAFQVSADQICCCCLIADSEARPTRSREAGFVSLRDGRVASSLRLSASLRRIIPAASARLTDRRH